MSNIVSIHQPEHLPWLGFFHKMSQCDIFVLLDSVQYEKDYFQNRNRIISLSSPQGWQWITVPVTTKNRSKQLICEVPIKYDLGRKQNVWNRRNWRIIRQEYGSAPYFNMIESSFQEVYSSGSWDLLVDLNLIIIKIFMGLLNLNTKIIRASDLRLDSPQSQLLLDICETLNADVYLSGPTGRDYLDVSLFDTANIAVEFHDFHHPVYPQQYSQFVPRMSVLDLIANCGPDSFEILVTGGGF